MIGRVLLLLFRRVVEIMRRAGIDDHLEFVTVGLRVFGNSSQRLGETSSSLPAIINRSGARNTPARPKLVTSVGKFFMSNIRSGARYLTIACRCGRAGPIVFKRVFRNLDFRL